MNIFAATLLSVLPRKYRPEGIPPAGALLSGILETCISLGFLIHGYFIYTDARLRAVQVDVMLNARAKGGDTAVMGLGSILLLEYLIHVMTIVLIILMLEGLVRAVAAFASDEVLPSLPLQAVAFLHDRLSVHGRERRSGRRVSDDVTLAPDGESLQIATCRPKPWAASTTISHEGVFYELVSENQGSAPRPFVYMLRKKHPTAVIRGIYAYHPDEALQTRN
jgi:hypothetical protein